MTKPQLFLSVLGLTVIGCSVAMIQGKTTLNPEHIMLSKAMSAEEKAEKASYKGALQYYKEVRANQITGEVSPVDVENAKAQANKMALDKKTRAFENMSWIAAGPNNVGGRTRGFCIDRTNPNRLYMGSVGGGFWISNDNGDNWAQRAGNDGSVAISVGTIAQTANGDIYYGTGEGNAGYDGVGNGHNQQIIQAGEGIFKSTDNASTFTQLANAKPANSNTKSDQWAFVDKIVAHPTDNAKLFAATNGGLKRTTDAGATWSKPTGVSITARFTDVEISADGNRVIASTVNSVYLSSDGGTTFSKISIATNGLPSVGGANCDVLIAPSNSDFMYVCFASNDGTLKGLYKSIDGGTSWTTLLQGGSGSTNPLGDQGTYDIAFGVHPLYPDMVFIGGQTQFWRYSDATGWLTIASSGASVVSGHNIHADMHGAWFNPHNPEMMYVICDGGMYRCTNSSSANPTFGERNKNFTTSQCYGIAANSLGRIIYGLQDNGSGIIGTNANSTLEAKDLTGGDGFRCAISEHNPNFIITSIYDGRLLKASDGGALPSSFVPFYDINIDGTDLDGTPVENVNQGMWVTPIEFKEKIITGESKSFIVISTIGSVWMSQNIVNGKAIWFKLATISGVKALSISSDGEVIYAGTAGGGIYRLDVPNLYTEKYRYNDTIENLAAGGFKFEDSITKTLIGNLGRFVTDLSCSPDGENLVATLGNYANTSYVYKATDARSSVGSANFSDISGNLPAMPVYTSLMVGGNPNKIMVGTELGIWGTDNSGTTWKELNMNNSTDESTWHPRVATYELVQTSQLKNADGSSNHGSVIYSGTHGRGVFKSISLAPILWPSGVNETTVNTNNIKVYPNPAIDIANINYPANTANDLNISVYSITGTKVYQNSFRTVVGENKLQINVSSFVKGAYIVVMNDGKTKNTSTLLKQ